MIRIFNRPRAGLAGRRIVITGASDGIGRELALQLAPSGAQLILLARRHGELDQVAELVQQLGGEASIYPVDLSLTDHVQAVANTVLDRHGGVDILVNNAGRSIRRPVAQSYQRLHDCQRTMQVNFFGALGLILAFLPGMRERRSGQIVNVSSMATQNATPPFAAYNASKAALDVWTRTAAAEMAPHGVSMTTVYMPLVNTAMSAATDAYVDARLLTPSQGAQLIYQGLGRRTPRIAPLAGTIGEILAALAPSLHRRATSVAYRRLPGFETAWRTQHQRTAEDGSRTPSAATPIEGIQ